MHPQLRLTFDETWSYSSDTFILHSGVMKAVDESIATATEPDRDLVYIAGDSLSGKTHFAVYLAAMLNTLGHVVHIMRGADVNAWFRGFSQEVVPTQPHSLIVDDAELWLEGQFGGGLFQVVRDFLKGSGGVLVLVSSKQVWHLQITPTIERSISSAVRGSISDPSADDLDSILVQMSLQRGVKFSKAKREFIIRRITTSIKSVSEALDRIQKAGQSARSSTSFRVLERALS
jgi:chromosomal replication initiation ATPase DnaA